MKQNDLTTYDLIDRFFGEYISKDSKVNGVETEEYDPLQTPFDILSDVFGFFRNDLIHDILENMDKLL